MANQENQGIVRDLTIREMEPRDIDAIATMHIALYDEMKLLDDNSPFLTHSHNEVTNLYLKFLRNKNMKLLVALINLQIVGMAVSSIQYHISERPALTANIDFVWVEKQFRRQGVGTGLVSKTISLLNKAGVLSITVAHLVKNQIGAAFWQKIGFAPLMTLRIKNKDNF